MANFLALITPPGTPTDPGGDFFGVVTLADLKKHLRIVTDDTEDEYLLSLIAAVTQMIDGANGWLGRCLLTQQWALTVDCFPACGFTLPLPPLQSVDAITYIDATGTMQTVDADDYILVESTPGRVIPRDGFSWPTSYETEAGITVTFTAGYGTPDDVPALIKHWIKLMCGTLYENRETLAVGVTVQELAFPTTMLDNYRVRGVM